MGRRVRPWLALAGSLLLHGGLLAALGWTLLRVSLPPDTTVIEARLEPLPPPVAKAPPPRPAEPLPRPKPRPVAAVPKPAAPPTPAAVAVAGEDASPVAVEPVAEMNDAEAPVPATADAAAPLNALPPRLGLSYRVRYGVASGEQSLVWVSDGDRYTLSSVASATGLAGVFYRGRFVQTSRGRITPQGLQPEEFWDQRGERHSSARFDALAGRITLTPAKGEPRHFEHAGTVQDALSLFFQLALTAPPPEQFTYAVFNGKKLRDYTYQVRGEVVLETALGALRTLHVARAVGDDGRFEAWLAIDRHYLPVRVVRSDDNGNAMELQLQSIMP